MGMQEVPYTSLQFDHRVHIKQSRSYSGYYCRKIRSGIHRAGKVVRSQGAIDKASAIWRQVSQSGGLFIL